LLIGQFKSQLGVIGNIHEGYLNVNSATIGRHIVSQQLEEG